MILAKSVSFLSLPTTTSRRRSYQNINPMEETGENTRGNSALWPCARRIASSMACELSSTDPTARLGTGWRSSIPSENSASFIVLLGSFVYDLRHIGSGDSCVAIASKRVRYKYLPGQVGGGGSYVCLQNGARDIQEPCSLMSLEIRNLGLTIVSHPGTGWDGSIWPRSLDTWHVLSFGGGLSSHSPWADLGVSEARFPAFYSLTSSCTPHGRRPYPAARYPHVDFTSARSTGILRNLYDSRLTWITGRLDYLAGWGRWDIHIDSRLLRTPTKLAYQ
jgi:hypothetical protein